MAFIPQNAKTNIDERLLNAIKNDCINYGSYIPYFTEATDLKKIGQALFDNTPLFNEWLNVLVNKVALSIFKTRMYSDVKFAPFKRGQLELGERIEEVFQDLIAVKDYDLDAGADEIYQRADPSVRIAYHILNSQKQYDVSIFTAEAEKAFDSMDAFTRFVNGIVAQLTKSAELDEYVMYKYLIASNAVLGYVKPTQVSTLSPANIRDIVIDIKTQIEDCQFMSGDYNLAGVMNYSDVQDLYLFVTPKMRANMDVALLAEAFHMEKAEVEAHLVTVNSFFFNDGEIKRLDMLMKNEKDWGTASNPGAKRTLILNTYKTALEETYAFLCDKDWFVCYDKLYTMKQVENPAALGWKYFLHVWKLYSTSPFETACVFSKNAPVVSTVKLYETDGVTELSAIELPTTVTDYQVIGKVTSSNYFANRAVEYSVAVVGTGTATVDNQGIVHIEDGADGDVITVTATSVFDSTKTASGTITLDDGT